MTLDYAVQTPPHDMATPDLFKAVVAIGQAKLDFRRLWGCETLITFTYCRPLNERIDKLLSEEGRRSFERYMEAKSESRLRKHKDTPDARLALTPAEKETNDG